MHSLRRTGRKWRLSLQPESIISLPCHIIPPALDLPSVWPSQWPPSYSSLRRSVPWSVRVSPRAPIGVTIPADCSGRHLAWTIIPARSHARPSPFADWLSSVPSLRGMLYCPQPPPSSPPPPQRHSVLISLTLSGRRARDHVCRLTGTLAAPPAAVQSSRGRPGDAGRLSDALRRPEGSLWPSVTVAAAAVVGTVVVSWPGDLGLAPG